MKLVVKGHYKPLKSIFPSKFIALRCSLLLNKYLIVVNNYISEFV